MAGEGDEAKGRIKKAAGELLDDDQLKREGEIDKATGKVKDVVEKAADKIQDIARKE